MNRRTFISLLGGAAAWPLAAREQKPERMPRIGLLLHLSPGPAMEIDAFRQGLHELGYVEGRNITIDYRFASGQVERLPELAAELVDLKPDVIVTPTTPASVAAKQASTTIPIVFAAMADAIGAGLVANLTRPGGNVTGFTRSVPSWGGNGSRFSRALSPTLPAWRFSTIRTTDPMY